MIERHGNVLVCPRGCDAIHLHAVNIKTVWNATRPEAVSVTFTCRQCSQRDELLDMVSPCHVLTIQNTEDKSGAQMFWELGK